MNSVIALPTTAPQSTGHPLSLPPDQARVAATTTVQPIGKGSGLDAGRDRGFAEQAPKPKSYNMDEKAAPPTIMQMKIETMLMEQAEKMASQEQAQEAEMPQASEEPQVAEKAPAPELATYEAAPEKPEEPVIKDTDQMVLEDADSSDRSSDFSTLP